MLRIIIIVFVICFTVNAQAQVVKLVCPKASALQFVQRKNQPYNVQAYVQIIQGTTPTFLMHGTADKKGILQFASAAFRRSEFSCNYHITTSPNTIITLVNEATFGLDYCYFEHSEQRHSCIGNSDHCDLVCDML